MAEPTRKVTNTASVVFVPRLLATSTARRALCGYQLHLRNFAANAEGHAESCLTRRICSAIALCTAVLLCATAVRAENFTANEYRSAYGQTTNRWSPLEDEPSPTTRNSILADDESVRSVRLPQPLASRRSDGQVSGCQNDKSDYLHSTTFHLALTPESGPNEVHFGRRKYAKLSLIKKAEPSPEEGDHQASGSGPVLDNFESGYQNWESNLARTRLAQRAYGDTYYALGQITVVGISIPIFLSSTR
jgi:hypothetical protein